MRIVAWFREDEWPQTRWHVFLAQAICYLAGVAIGRIL